jgi:hypothetical protein
MTKHMIISPDPRMDGTWAERGRGTIRWVAPMPAVSLSANPFMDVPDIESATLQPYFHPGWKVRLRFWVDNRLGPSPRLERGRVMPGWVHGMELEQSPLEIQPLPPGAPHTLDELADLLQGDDDDDSSA